MKYLISQYGDGIAVGLTQEQGAQEDINLAHNLFNSYAHPSIFQGTILFDSLKQFRKFLAFKEFFKIRPNNTPNEFKVWREAFRRAAVVLKDNCRAENFMLQMTVANNSKHNVGFYQDETDFEC